MSKATTLFRALAPCPHPPRSSGRLDAYAARAALGLPLFHRYDAGQGDRLAVLCRRRPNGVDSRGGLVMQGSDGMEVLEPWRDYPSRSAS